MLPSVFEDDCHHPSESQTQIIKNKECQRVAQITIEVVKHYETLKSSRELSTHEIQKQIVKDVSNIIKQDQSDLELASKHDLVKEVVETVTKNLPELIIDIPNIVLTPPRDLTYGFHEFDLSNLEQLNFQPVSHEILIRQLRTNKSSLLLSNNDYKEESNLENYIVNGLSNDNLVDYEKHTDLLYKLAGEVVARFRSYLPNNQDVRNVLIHHQKEICEFILAQLRQHYWEKTPTKYEVSIKRGFKILTPFSYSIQDGSSPQDFRSIPEVKKDVKKIVFGGFTKCCYSLQKFDSVDGELRFAQILEDDNSVIRWIKPSPGFFKIEYKNGASYEPDFIVETKDAKYLCEPKMESEINNETVLAKKEAAVRWCNYATKHAQESSDKPWHYILIPHNSITSNQSFEGLVKKFKRVN